jgi:hypothetical protein
VLKDILASENYPPINFTIRLYELKTNLFFHAREKLSDKKHIIAYVLKNSTHLTFACIYLGLKLLLQLISPTGVPCPQREKAHQTWP